MISPVTRACRRDDGCNHRLASWLRDALIVPNPLREGGNCFCQGLPTQFKKNWESATETSDTPHFNSRMFQSKFDSVWTAKRNTPCTQVLSSGQLSKLPFEVFSPKVELLLSSKNGLSITVAYGFTIRSSLATGVAYKPKQSLTVAWNSFHFYFFGYLGPPVFRLS